MLAAAGGLLTAFFAYLNWFDTEGWWYSGGSDSVRLVYGLLAPAGYLLLLLAGLPERTERGRVALSVAIGAGAMMGAVGFESDVAWAIISCIIIQAIFGSWAAVLAIRSPNMPTLAGWLLLACLATLPLIFLLGNDETSARAALVLQTATVAVSGLIFLGLALRLGRRGGPRAAGPAGPAGT